MSTNLVLDPMGMNKNPITGLKFSDKYKDLAKKWSTLPAYEKATDIIHALKSNQIILITSGTGSGKTLLLPRYTLEAFEYKAKIAITLPKQILTVSNAQYQSEILDVTLGKEIGYVYKGSDKKYANDKNLLLYATDGTIVSKLLQDPELKEFNAVIIDEAHERKVQIDLLLYLLKQTCKLRKDFKLIIMSATINEDIFINYFTDFKFKHFDVGGKTNYPIESIFLDSPLDKTEYITKGYEIINKLLLSDEKHADILFFVPSIQETFDLCKKIDMDASKNNIYCSTVYAGMDTLNQEIAQDEELYKTKFNKTRKVVIATNVAESSLTISGIKYVIDSGYEFTNYYDPVTNSNVLDKQLITQAQVKQRMGRAGRTAIGICYHLYTKNDFNNMKKYPEPNIRTSNITTECLKLLNLPIVKTLSKLKNVLNEFIEPPTDLYINSALSCLLHLQLIDNNNITDLGKLIVDMQLDVMQGVSIYYAYNLFCVKEVIAIIAMIDACKGTINGLYNVPKEDQNDVNNRLLKKFKESKKLLINKSGDHLTLYKIFEKYTMLRKTKSNKLDDWLYSNFLKKSVLEKAMQYFHKTRGITMRVLENINVKQIKNNYKLSDKIIASFAKGFSMNIAHLHNNNYDTQKLNNVQISKDSYLYYIDIKHKDIVYNELFTFDKKTNIIIASNINKNVKEIVHNI